MQAVSNRYSSDRDSSNQKTSKKTKLKQKITTENGKEIIESQHEPEAKTAAIKEILKPVIKKIKLEEPELETVAEEVPELEPIEYGFEQFMSETVYTPTSFNYLDFYGPTREKKDKDSEDYQSESTTKIISDVKDQQLSVAEAEQTIIRIQYAAALKNLSEVNYSEREKFAQWVKFNPVLMRMFETVHSMTQEVDYSRTI